MMRLVTFAIAAGAVLASSLPGNAASQYGMETCSEWLRSSRAARAEVRTTNAWIFGYLDATSALVDANRQIKGLPPSKMLEGMSDASILALFERFCARSPQQTVGEVLTALTAQLIASEKPQVYSRRQ